MSVKSLLAWLCAFPLLAHAGPKIEHWTLANGAKVYFVRAVELPMVQVRVVFDAAAARDPRKKTGVAQLTNSMLNEGAAQLSADEIADRFESLGAEFHTGAGRDMATVDLRSLTDAELLAPALDLFTQIISAPSFPAESFARERQRLTVDLSRDDQSPGEVAHKAFMRALYGDHPYANDPTGSRESLARITRDDLIAHYKRFYVGRNARLIMIGDLTADQARSISEKVMGELPAGEAAPALPPVAPLKAARVERIPFRASQSHVYIGQPGIVRTDPDYFALYTGNYILGGGGLVSRLSDEVREKRGLSYSVYSGFSAMRAPGPFMLSLQTKNATADQAVTIARDVLRDFMQKGPTEDELEKAKKHITGGYALDLDSNKKIADQLMAIAYYDLPLTYLDAFSKQIESITAQQIREAFARHIDPQRTVTVIVGGKP